MTQAPEMPELKSCPFCGGEMEDRGYGAIHVAPNKCPIGGYAVDTSRWNTRADLPPTPAEAMRCPEVAALVEAVRHEREMVCQDWDLQMEASKNVEKALGNMGVYPYSGVV